MKIIYTKKFLRSFKKLHQDIQKTYRQKEEIFSSDPFHSQLKTHKLEGTNYYSFSVTYKIRVIFQKINGIVLLLNIGDHSVYREL